MIVLYEVLHAEAMGKLARFPVFKRVTHWSVDMAGGGGGGGGGGEPGSLQRAAAGVDC